LTKTGPLVVATTLAAEKGRGLTVRIAVGSPQSGNGLSNVRTSRRVSGGQSGFTSVPSNPCVVAVAVIARVSSAFVGL